VRQRLVGFHSHPPGVLQIRSVPTQTTCRPLTVCTIFFSFPRYLYALRGTQTGHFSSFEVGGRERSVPALSYVCGRQREQNKTLMHHCTTFCRSLLLTNHEARHAMSEWLDTCFSSQKQLFFLSLLLACRLKSVLGSRVTLTVKVK